MKWLFVTIAAALFSGCGGSPNIPLNKTTDVKFDYSYKSIFGGKVEVKAHLVMDCEMAKLYGEIPALKIQVTNKGEEELDMGGNDFYQIDRDGNVISAMEEDLQIPDMNGYHGFRWQFNLNVGEVKTGYLKLRSNSIRVEYRARTTDGRKTMFSIDIPTGS